MKCILQRNNTTGETGVKKYAPFNAMRGNHSTVPEEVAAYQRYYDNIFGKHSYSFYFGDDSEANNG